MNFDHLYPPPPFIPERLFDFLRMQQDLTNLISGCYPLGGIRIIASRFLPTERREQFRFPRSKKARMRKKWRKDQKNWRTVDARGDIYFIGSRTAALIHPDGYEALKKTVGVIRNCELK